MIFAYLNFILKGNFLNLRVDSKNEINFFHSILLSKILSDMFKLFSFKVLKKCDEFQKRLNKSNMSSGISNMYKNVSTSPRDVLKRL